MNFLSTLSSSLLSLSCCFKTFSVCSFSRFVFVCLFILNRLICAGKNHVKIICVNSGDHTLSFCPHVRGKKNGHPQVFSSCFLDFSAERLVLQCRTSFLKHACRLDLVPFVLTLLCAFIFIDPQQPTYLNLYFSISLSSSRDHTLLGVFLESLPFHSRQFETTSQRECFCCSELSVFVVSLCHCDI